MGAPPRLAFRGRGGSLPCPVKKKLPRPSLLVTRRTIVYSGNWQWSVGLRIAHLQFVLFLSLFLAPTLCRKQLPHPYQKKTSWRQRTYLHLTLIRGVMHHWQLVSISSWQVTSKVEQEPTFDSLPVGHRGHHCQNWRPLLLSLCATTTAQLFKLHYLPFCSIMLRLASTC